MDFSSFWPTGVVRENRWLHRASCLATIWSVNLVLPGHDLVSESCPARPRSGQWILSCPATIWSVNLVLPGHDLVSESCPAWPRSGQWILSCPATIWSVNLVLPGHDLVSKSCPARPRSGQWILSCPATIWSVNLVLPRLRRTGSQEDRMKKGAEKRKDDEYRERCS